MIIGMIRYSIPNAFGESISRDINKLFEDPYFSDRLNIFRSITLESFRQQTDQDFKLLVYHTNLIPEDKKVLFDDIEKEYKFVRNIYIPDNKLCVPNDLKEDVNLTFRIDNDDGIAIDFIERLQAVKARYVKDKVISIPHIYKLIRINKNEYMTKSTNYVSNSIGLAYMTTKQNQTIMDLGVHTKISRKYELKLLDGNGGLQIINGYNVINSFDKKVGENDTKPLTLDKKGMEEFLIKQKYARMDLSSICV